MLRGLARRETAPIRGTVLFVHGLWMTGGEAFLLKRRLSAHGWVLRIFPYSSLAEPMPRIAKRCARYAQMLATRTKAPVHMVGHSLGGLVIYRMFELELLAANRFSGDFCRVVFLGTPVHGSQSGRVLAQMGPARVLLGQAGGAELLDDLPRQWRFTPQLGIIAGNRPRGLGRLISRLEGANDGTVAVSETELPGATAHCEVSESHTSMLMSADVAEQIATFLETGAFQSSAARSL